jgi:hypothetical protein
MASLVLKMSASLAGYVAPPEGSSDRVAARRFAIGLDVQRSAGS